MKLIKTIALLLLAFVLFCSAVDARSTAICRSQLDPGMKDYYASLPGAPQVDECPTGQYAVGVGSISMTDVSSVKVGQSYSMSAFCNPAGNPGNVPCEPASVSWKILSCTDKTNP
ncbi:MAG: hypothetical protein Q7R47_06345, partial [Candidatus Diapherotrites archaeon]|nr:hypothetical protein [Candidatus Diapherotrites archaeon]